MGGPQRPNPAIIYWNYRMDWISPCCNPYAMCTFDLDSQTRRKLGHQLIEVVDQFFSSLAYRAVQPPANERCYPPDLAQIPATRQHPTKVLDQVCREVADKGFTLPTHHFRVRRIPLP